MRTTRACTSTQPKTSAAISREMNVEHPPLGKWLMAAGEAAFGHNAVGWRLSALVAGVLAVAVTYLCWIQFRQSLPVSDPGSIVEGSR